MTRKTLKRRAARKVERRSEISAEMRRLGASAFREEVKNWAAFHRSITAFGLDTMARLIAERRR